MPWSVSEMLIVLNFFVERKLLFLCVQISVWVHTIVTRPFGTISTLSCISSSFRSLFLPMYVVPTKQTKQTSRWMSFSNRTLLARRYFTWYFIIHHSFRILGSARHIYVISVNCAIKLIFCAHIVLFFTRMWNNYPRLFCSLKKSANDCTLMTKKLDIFKKNVFVNMSYRRYLLRIYQI